MFSISNFLSSEWINTLKNHENWLLHVITSELSWNNEGF